METKTKENEYDIQAAKFVQDTGITIAKRYMGHTRRLHQDTPTAEFEITITREGVKSWAFQFNDCIVNSYRKPRYRGQEISEGQQVHRSPGDYDILACLSICYAETLGEFCDEFGYDTDSIKARDLWLAVQDESAALRHMFTEAELEKLAEIN